MNITYIGLDNECSTKICNYLSESHAITLITNREPIYEIDCKTIVSKKLWVENYFSENETELIIYNDIDDDYNLLNKWLFASVRNVKYFIIVKPEKLVNEEQFSTSIEKLLAEEYIKNSSTKIRIIHPSAFYGSKIAPKSIENIIERIIKNNSIKAEKNFNDQCDVIHIDDFCSFMENYIRKIDDICDTEIYVHSGYVFNADELFSKICGFYPQAEKLYDNNDFFQNRMADSIHIKEWSPKHSFIEDLDSTLNLIEERFQKANVKRQKKAIGFAGKIIVMILGFLIVELYTNFMSVASEMQYADLRLAFISIIAVMFGKKHAIASSLLCSVGNVLQSIIKGYRWHVIFFHVNNWIPIAIYIVFATLLGTFMEKYNSEKKN